jgi:metal-dependent amidase/aminoacylase/carboxypeptidase family protein
VRTLEDGVREKVCAAIHRVVEGECMAAGAVERPRIIRTVSSPATVNDEVSVGRLRDVFREYFRDALVGMESPSASEDFSLLATAVGAPYVMWMFGGVEEETWDEAVAKGTVNELPSNHSPYFAPVIQPTLRAGVDAMALGALTFLGRK